VTRRWLVAFFLAAAALGFSPFARAGDVSIPTKAGLRYYQVKPQYLAGPLRVAKSYWQKTGRRPAMSLPQVTAAARRFGLHPSALKPRDVAFLHSQHQAGHLSACRVIVELAARRAALDAASAQGVPIHHQGELAQAAAPLRGYFLQRLGCR
jgi:hypothetical protein